MKHTCTTFLAGKAATIDGSTLICRQEDYGNAFDPQRFVVVKPEEQPRHYASKTTSFTLETIVLVFLRPVASMPPMLP